MTIVSWYECRDYLTTLDFTMFSPLICFPFFQAIYYTIFGWPEKDLNNELCVVTGGGGGLGRLLAMRLAQLGVKVILWDINQEGKKREI